MRAKPYIGITGAKTVSEVDNIISEYNKDNFEEHVLMLGFLASYKTLNNIPTTNRRYPQIEELPHLIQHSGKRAFNMVHYNSKEIDTLASQIDQIFSKLPKEFCRALQLNIPWPDLRQVEKIMNAYPELQIVLQLSSKAMANKNKKEIVDKVQDYNGLASYVLIDPSGGNGLEFNIDVSVDIYSELNMRLPDLTIGLAGGFTGENVKQRLEELSVKLNSLEFCIDAESGLRDKLSDNYGDDLLNFRKVRHYLQSAARVLW